MYRIATIATTSPDWSLTNVNFLIIEDVDEKLHESLCLKAYGGEVRHCAGERSRESQMPIGDTLEKNGKE